MTVFGFIYFLFALGLIRSCLAANRKSYCLFEALPIGKRMELFLLNRNEQQVVPSNDAVAYSLTAPGVISHDRELPVALRDAQSHGKRRSRHAGNRFETHSQYLAVPRRRQSPLVTMWQETILQTRDGSETRPVFIVREKDLPMKILLITLIAAIGLTHAVQARDWAWFHGDIGLSSPFVSSRQSAHSITPVVTRQKASPNRAGAGSKVKSLSHRITAR
jgi:hypothetical protein